MWTSSPEATSAPRAAGCPGEEPEVVVLGVPERPQMAGGGEQEVEAVESDVAGEHLGRGDDPGPYVALVLADRHGHQGEEPLGVRLALHQGAVGAGTQVRGAVPR
jgi:hypothetical protein